MINKALLSPKVPHHSDGLGGRELKCTSLSTAPNSTAFEIALDSWFQDVSLSPSDCESRFTSLPQ